MDFKVISIGALASNPLWNERSAVRTGHATTTLITSGKHKILVDPGLPEQALAARLNERTGLKPKDITHVFLTSFLPDTRRALPLFDHATWWIASAEREFIGGILATNLKEMLTSEQGGEGEKSAARSDPALRQLLETDIAILKRCSPAPDHLADRVDLFPLHGVTPGLSGLILSGERFTTVICGDAIPTQEHLESGKLLPSLADAEKARASFEEAVEVADLLIPGRDNLTVNPTRRPF
ncbi:MAG TPA: MBL fold metallo-hydrolase [Phycisphaerales bacterium]|nr:MBL fold metallo-hydrolase [Phycisphaerales bacterium]